jgi:hypothetical protein
MNKTIMTLLLLLGLITTMVALPRNLVVVEVGTGTWCGFCPGAAMGCHDLLNNGHAVAIVKNHNGDSYANTYSNARNSFYGISGYPTAFFDGLNPTVGGSSSSSMYSSYLPKVNARLAVPSHFSISAVGNSTGNQYTVLVTVSKPEADTNTNVKLHAVLTETNIPQVWFNQTTVDNVNRLMVPDQNGTVINLGTGEQTTANLNFTVQPSWNLANCEMVFFLQNMTTKEILQGVKYSLAALVGAYPVSHETLDFPNMYVTGSATIPVTIVNFGSTTATGTISIDNPAFSSSISAFSIPATQSQEFTVAFTPTAAQQYSGTMTIVGNLYNHPNITIPLSGTGFVDTAPTATGVAVSGPPVIYQTLSGDYVFSDPDGDAEGSSVLKWYRVVNQTPVQIPDATESTYTIQDEDLGLPIVFEVTPYDEHGMPGNAVSSTPTVPIEELPPPQNLTAQLNPPDTVVLNWQRPQYFEGRGFVGYRLFRNGLNISTITNPSTLTFTDTYVPLGVHEYWICSLFNNPMVLSGPSNVVTVNIGTANDDQILPAAKVSVYPNPFNAYTSIDIQAKANQTLTLGVYNTKGQLVKTWTQITNATGQTSIQWDGTDANGSPTPAGIYFYRVSGSDLSRHGKIIRIH